jgi:hypothetical protein
VAASAGRHLGAALIRLRSRPTFESAHQLGRRSDVHLRRRTALAAHQYGLSWFEHQGTGSANTFVAHPILPSGAGTNNFSQPHAMVAVDVDGDGLTDLITGKRYYAHPSDFPDPGTTDPAVTYWFELERGPGGATFVPHLIHSDSGVGCNFVARDVTGDGKVDIFTTNKRGTFLHIQQ